MFTQNQWRIFAEDVVQVVTGSEKGATGRVLAVMKDKKQPEVIVEGVNMVSARTAGSAAGHTVCDTRPHPG
jgi:ribosomal protein L24